MHWAPKVSPRPMTGDEKVVPFFAIVPLYCTDGRYHWLEMVDRVYAYQGWETQYSRPGWKFEETRPRTS